MTGNNKTYKLEASNRAEAEKAAEVRAAGFVPVELYGRKEENSHLKIKANDFNKVFAAAGESSLIDLNIDGSSVGKILVKDTQIDPVKDTIIHADLYKIDMNEKLTTEIPLTFTGVAPAVKELGGILVKQVDSVHVQCLPGDLVHEIEVNLSGLATFEDSILIKDLTLPEGIEVLNDETVLVASVSEPRKVEEETPVEAEGEAAEAEAKEEGEAEAKEEGEAKAE